MELLSPAGNFEKLKIAVTYGADAVYFGGEMFGLRAMAGNFTIDEMKEAMDYLHEKGKKGYLTVNAYPHDNEMDGLGDYLKSAAGTGIDGFIISDPGVFHIAKSNCPTTPILISTQANTTNLSAVNFWHSMGASRVILARELSKADVEKIAKNSPIDIEIFAHGAICISYSGRCLISSYMTGRDANRGECTQPCRWNYSLVEKTRPGQYMPVVEDEKGTFFYNAKDLCLIDRVGEMAEMNIASLKIEGRMKSVMYVAITTAVYRQAIDLAKKGEFAVNPNWRRLLDSVSNRTYTEGFYSSVKDDTSMNYDTSSYVRNSDFLGVVTKEQKHLDMLTVNCRGKFLVGEKVVFITPKLDEIDYTIEKITTLDGRSVDSSRPNDNLGLYPFIELPEGTLLRRIL